MGLGGRLTDPRRSHEVGYSWVDLRGDTPCQGVDAMSDDGTLDDAKGRLKEAAGDVTDDQSLKNEGKVDRATGSIKDGVGDAADKVKDVVNPND
jgi:uncharacterized protein YjbJ (UPF0337 family)